MAATQCNISFAIDYTSSQPIIGAKASYKIQGSADAPYIHNITPIPASGNVISLPNISVPGEYELIVELTGTDGKVVTEKSKFKIGNCSGNTPPKVSIKWRDNSGTEDRVCTSTCNEHIISVVSSDADNDIVKREVLLSLDNGNTWTIYNPDLSTNTIFGTGTLSTAGKRLFKVVVTDSVGNTVGSNSLSYTKEKDDASVCRYLYNFNDARLDITALSANSNNWVTATVDVNSSAIGKTMNLAFEIHYRRCNDGFNNIVQVLGTDNELLKEQKVENILSNGQTGLYSFPLTYTPTKAGQIKLKISKYSSFLSPENSPAYLHIDSQLLFLNNEDVCGTLSAEHNFSIYGGSDCSST